MDCSPRTTSPYRGYIVACRRLAVKLKNSVVCKAGELELVGSVPCLASPLLRGLDFLGHFIGGMDLLAKVRCSRALASIPERDLSGANVAPWIAPGRLLRDHPDLAHAGSTASGEAPALGLCRRADLAAVRSEPTFVRGAGLGVDVELPDTHMWGSSVVLPHPGSGQRRGLLDRDEQERVVAELQTIHSRGSLHGFDGSPSLPHFAHPR